MPENNDISISKFQKELKPKIEDVIPIFLEGVVKNSALGFIAHMRENKMQPVWSAHNSWSANYKGKKICTVKLPLSFFPYKRWVIIPHISRWSKITGSYNEYEGAIKNDGLQNLVWENVNVCRSCANCGPGWDTTFLGRDFKNVCHNIPVWFRDPDEKEIEFVKIILRLMRQTMVEKK